MGVERWKTVSETLQAFATTAALLIAGVWTYLLFVRQRQRFPRADLHLKITSKRLSPSHDLLHIQATMKNVGNVLISLASARARIGRVTPLSSDLRTVLATGGDLVQANETDIRWPELGRRDCAWPDNPREIEPGESDAFHFDFVLQKGLEAVEVFCYFRNVVKVGREMGWSQTALVDLQPMVESITPEGEPSDAQEKGAESTEVQTQETGAAEVQAQEETREGDAERLTAHAPDGARMQTASAPLVMRKRSADRTTD